MSIWDEEPLAPMPVLRLEAERIAIGVEIRELEVQLDGLRWSYAKLEEHIRDKM